MSQRGVCWSTVTNPTIANSLTNDGTGLGLFNSVLDNLIGCGTSYYIRAYATNSLGTGYGNQLAVSSGLLPLVVSTTSITDITKISAVCGGTINSDGGCDITERGICWNRYPNPTISNFKTVSGSGIGTFSTSLTGLYPNDIYYVRAYATNSKGTGYGPELTFKTQAGVSGAAIGQFYAGGLVFYLDETGDHGLVCATSDLEPMNICWGCQGTLISGTHTDIGTGAANTATILANCAEEGIAARLCDELELNGYTDWYLPSKDELNLIYYNLKLANPIDFAQQYWSSSENDAISAWNQIFRDGGQNANYKTDNGIKVRATRAF